MAPIQYFTQIQLDFGVLKLLPQECERHGIRRPLVVTDAGVLDRVLAALGALPHAVLARLGLPPGLAALGVSHRLFDRVIDGAMADHCHKTSPRIVNVQDYRGMIESSM